MRRLVEWIRRFAEELRRRRVIRVAVVYAGSAFVVLQLAAILVGPFGLPGWTLRLITLALILGFPLAVGLAWVFNVTEEGVVRAGGEAASAPLTSNGLIAGLLIVAIGLLLYPRVFSSGGGESPAQSTPADTARVGKRSVAVLPFSNLSGQSEARSHQERLKRLQDGSWTKFTEVLVLYHERRWEDLKRLSEDLLSSEPAGLQLPSRFYLARTATERGDTSSARHQLEKIREETPEKKPRFGSGRVFEGLVHAVLGDEGAAFSAWRQIDDWWINLHLLRYCFSDVLAPLRRDPRYEKLIHEINEYWGLNPDGSIPDSVGVSLQSNPEADA